ncbi:hypothetical protein ABIA57_001612 [Pseudomonas frederiksbergensis]
MAWGYYRESGSHYRPSRATNNVDTFSQLKVNY